MQIAIVGLARSGKTTVFNTLTRGHAETGGFGGLTVNTGVVKVPDERLTRLTELFKPKREVPADVTYVDLPAPPAAADGQGRRHPGRPARAAAQRRTRCSTWSARSRTRRVPHPDGSVDPWRDLEQLELEFALADLAVVEKRIEKLRHDRAPRHASRARGQRARAGGARADRARPSPRDGRSATWSSADDETRASAASAS